jgi:hypothetical protein
MIVDMLELKLMRRGVVLRADSGTALGSECINMESKSMQAARVLNTGFCERTTGYKVITALPKTVDSCEGRL